MKTQNREDIKLIEIHKITGADLISKLEIGNITSECYNYVGVFDNGNLINYAGYIFIDDSLSIEILHINDNNYSLVDGLIKTLIFYADLKKIRFLKISEQYSEIAQKFNFKQINSELILDIYSQDKKCLCDKERK